MTKFFSCSITGPRPARFSFGYDEDHMDCVALKNEIKGQVELLYEAGIRSFYSGVEMGVDMWGAEEIIKLKCTCRNIKLICVEPFKGREKYWPLEEQKRYQTIIRNSDGRISLSDFSVCDRYQIRNLYMIEKSDVLLAVYDWNHPNIKSGTGRTIRQAQEYRKKIYMLNPVTFETIISEKKRERWIG